MYLAVKKSFWEFSECRKRLHYCYQGLREGGSGYIVPGPGSTGARAQGARKSSGFPIKLKYRTITP